MRPIIFSCTSSFCRCLAAFQFTDQVLQFIHTPSKFITYIYHILCGSRHCNIGEGVISFLITNSQ